jgi:hypothetical protein
MIFDASVFPLPDSPLMTMQVSLPCCFITLWAESAMANIWGGFSKISRPGIQKKQTFKLNTTKKSFSYFYSDIFRFFERTFVFVDRLIVVNVDGAVWVDRDAHFANVSVDCSTRESATEGRACS